MPCVTVALVVPFRVTEMEFGGQVLKKPADDPDPAIEAVIAVVPGCAAVIMFVAALSIAIEEVPTEYESVPIELEQTGTELTPGANPPGHE
jgi:hypothetical protein